MPKKLLALASRVVTAPRPPATAPGWGAPTNAIPATVPCPACGAPAAVTALEDRRTPGVAIVELTTVCACGMRLDAVGVDKSGDPSRAERVALDDLRAVYRARQRAVKT